MYQDQRGYWYRSRRYGQCVTTIYYGRGEDAETLREFELEDRARARDEREEFEAFKAHYAALDAPLEAFCAHTDQLMRSALESAGYHQYARGQWRKRRTNKPGRKRSNGGSPVSKAIVKQEADSIDGEIIEADIVETDIVTADVSKADITKKKARITNKEIKKMSALLVKAQHDPQAAKELMKLATANGTVREIAKGFGMADQVETQLLQAFAGDNYLQRELGKLRLADLRRELEGPNPSPLEVLLAERIALCWFQLHQCEITLARGGIGMKVHDGEFHQKRLDTAHKRYLSAIKTLAQVRKLQVPTVQVNIGEKQINVANVSRTS